MSGFWRRFTPYLALTISRSSAVTNLYPSQQMASGNNLEKRLRQIISLIHKEVGEVNFAKPITHQLQTRLTDKLEEFLGFRLCLRKSQIKEAGEGIFMEKGSASTGDIVAIYPGTVYHVGDPILFQSINNHFVLKCADGILVDGKPSGLSAKIHKSCIYRDLAPFVCDMSWMNPKKALNFMNIGHFVNNGGRLNYNVQYIDIDISKWPYAYRRYLPYAIYKPMHSATFRVVALVACRSIEEGEELLSPYISISSTSK